MEIANVARTTKEINDRIREFPWMDFEVKKYSGGVLELHGAIDLLTPRPDIIVLFSEVFFLAAPFGWRTETKNDVFFLVSGDEARELNISYQVEQGNFIFKFRPEYYPDSFGCYIAARGVEIK